MATTAVLRDRPARRPPIRERLKNYGRGVTYQIAGLPIAVRATIDRTGRSPEAVIRRAYAQRFWRPRGLSEASQLALAILGWPLALLGLEAVFVIKNGAAIAPQRPVHRQLFDQLRLYLSSGVLPPWYYIFELHQQPAPRQARDYIYRWESKGGVMQLLRNRDHKCLSELNDKYEFARHCAAYGLATVPILALVTDGQSRELASLKADLFVKPLCGRGGKGAERWDYAKGFYRNPAGEELDREGLFSRLEARSQMTPLIVQSRLRNHAGLKPLNNDALSTVRILTCLNEFGEPEIVGAAMRMAIGSNHVVDNLHAGGIAAAVDLEKGILGRASNLGSSSAMGWMDRHPDSGAQITGTRLPMWQAVRDFAIAAHRAFDDRVLVGWDIAITPGGPVLVEGNGSPDLDIMQRFVRHGLMGERLGELLAFHLSQIGAERLAA